MNRFFKVEDPEIIKAFLEQIAVRSKFIEDWNAEGVRRGFTGANLINWRYDRAYDIHASGFLATKAQLNNRDRSIYKAGCHYEKTNEYVVHVKLGNKQAFKEYLEILPHKFDGQRLEDQFYETPDPDKSSFFREINWNVPNLILLSSSKADSDLYKLKPCVIEIKQSEYLALQGE
ncbi:hypothetical protein [Acinetobacter venetianus]|uniref:hypothetical protein n=1 Tax=Acinetobacter venetianus TaxID=52133 RepID=UPI003A8D4CEA